MPGIRHLRAYVAPVGWGENGVSWVIVQANHNILWLVGCALAFSSVLCRPT